MGVTDISTYRFRFKLITASCFREWTAVIVDAQTYKVLNISGS